MQVTFKTVTSTIVLVLTSWTSYYFLVAGHLSIGGGITQISKGSFGRESVRPFVNNLLVVAGFLAAYIISVVYLCKQLYAVKKWMVFIPILASFLIALLGFLLIWRDFQGFE